MNAADLITLQNVKDWLNTASGSPQPPFPKGSDVLLSRLVTAVSRFAGQYLQRQIQPANYVETYNGFETYALTLRNSPVISVTSVTIGNTIVPARETVNGHGFVADATTLYVPGYLFCRGVQNVAVSYRAGFQATDTIGVPTAEELSVTELSRPWNGDQGVAYAGGAAFTLVTTTPSVAGTYQITPDQAGTAQYVFARADAGASVVITYGYTPEDVVQALVELAGERFKARNRIGENSQSFNGQNVTFFSQKDMNAAIKQMLQPWRVVVPIA